MTKTKECCWNCASFVEKDWPPPNSEWGVCELTGHVKSEYDCCGNFGNFGVEGDRIVISPWYTRIILTKDNYDRIMNNDW